MCAGFGEGTVGLDPTFCTLLCRAFGCVSFLADLGVFVCLTRVAFALFPVCVSR